MSVFVFNLKRKVMKAVSDAVLRHARFPFHHGKFCWHWVAYDSGIVRIHGSRKELHVWCTPTDLKVSIYGCEYRPLLSASLSDPEAIEMAANFAARWAARRARLHGLYRISIGLAWFAAGSIIGAIIAILCIASA